MEDSVILEVFSNRNDSDLWGVSRGLELNKQASADVGHPLWSSRFSCWIEEENIFLPHFAVAQRKFSMYLEDVAAQNPLSHF